MVRTSARKSSPKNCCSTSFSNSVPTSPFRKAPRKVSFIAGGKTLASSDETMIPIPEVGSTATAMHSSKTQVTRTATFFKETPQLIPLEELSSAHQLVKKLFCNLKIPAVPLVGRLVHFKGNWEKLSKDQNILQIVK